MPASPAKAPTKAPAKAPAKAPTKAAPVKAMGRGPAFPKKNNHVLGLLGDGRKLRPKAG